MTSIIAVIEQIIMLFCITAIGYCFRRKGVMSDTVIKGVNTILLQAAWPAMIIMTTQKEGSADAVNNFLKILIFATVLLAVLTLALYLFCKRHFKNGKSEVFTILSTLPNAGFIGLPIIRAVYGDAGVLYLSAFIVAFNLVLWTICICMFAGFNLSSLEAILNPGFIASVVGTALFFLRIKLPAPLLSLSNQLGGLTTPLAMLLLGARLGQLTRKTLTDKTLWISCIIKLTVMPLITLAIVSILRVDKMLVGIVVLSMGMPSASVAQLFAEKYDGDVMLSAAGVSVSTLCCIVTLPLILALIGV